MHVTVFELVHIVTRVCEHVEMGFGCSLVAGPVAMRKETAISYIYMERVRLQECCQLRPSHSATPQRVNWVSQTSSSAAWTTTQQILELLMAWLDSVEDKMPSQLSQLTSSNVFSYCLVPFYGTISTSPLLFGASNSNGLQLAYTPVLTIDDVLYSTYYTVNMTGISIDGTAVSIPTAPLEWNATTRSGGTFFDSGTTFTFFNKDIYTPVVQVNPSHILGMSCILDDVRNACMYDRT
jgi:hypothetical protein